MQENQQEKQPCLGITLLALSSRAALCSPEDGSCIAKLDPQGSPPLLRQLLFKRWPGWGAFATWAYCCGTTRSYRKKYPAVLKGVHLERGQHKSQTVGNVHCFVWKDKKIDFVQTIFKLSWSIQQFWREFTLREASTNSRLLGMYIVLYGRTRKLTSNKQFATRVRVGLLRGRTRMVHTQWWAALCRARFIMRKREVWTWWTLSSRCTVAFASRRSGGTNFFYFFSWTLV